MALGVDSVSALSSVHVPEFDRPIISSSGSCQHSVLPRAETHAFDGSLVLTGSKRKMITVVSHSKYMITRLEVT